MSLKQSIAEIAFRARNVARRVDEAASAAEAFSRRLATDAEFRNDVADLIQIGILVYIFVTFFIAPSNLIRGRADGLADIVLGVVGIGFWIAAAIVFARQFSP